LSLAWKWMKIFLYNIHLIRSMQLKDNTHSRSRNPPWDRSPQYSTVHYPDHSNIQHRNTTKLTCRPTQYRSPGSTYPCLGRSICHCRKEAGRWDSSPRSRSRNPWDMWWNPRSTLLCSDRSIHQYRNTTKIPSRPTQCRSPGSTCLCLGRSICHSRTEAGRWDNSPQSHSHHPWDMKWNLSSTLLWWDRSIRRYRIVPVLPSSSRQAHSFLRLDNSQPHRGKALVGRSADMTQ
jgi:hypothetical protein